MKGQAKDLRDSFTDIELVKEYADDTFGFWPSQVVPLETCGGDPAKYCMFEVCGIEYQVRDGRLSIYRQGGGDE